MKNEESKLNAQPEQLDIPVVNKRYFIIRRYNCGTSADTTDILGLTVCGFVSVCPLHNTSI